MGPKKEQSDGKLLSHCWRGARSLRFVMFSVVKVVEAGLFLLVLSTSLLSFEIKMLGQLARA